MQARTCRRAVLVAEDNVISREVLLHQLRLLGCDAVAAEDGAAAARAWHAGDFALLFTDLQMPGLDGYELAAHIRGEESAARMPIVALTANAAPAESERCAAAGMDGYLTKPASLATLRGVLEKWLEPVDSPVVAARSPPAGSHED